MPELTFAEKVRQRLRKKQNEREEEMFSSDPYYKRNAEQKQKADKLKKRPLTLEDIE